MKKIEKAMELLDEMAAIAAKTKINVACGSAKSRKVVEERGVELPDDGECLTFMTGLVCGCATALASVEDIANGREADAHRAIHCAINAWIHSIVEEDLDD